MTVDWGALFEFLARLVTAISAIGALIISWRNAGKINRVHVDLNSRLSQLLERTRGEAFLAGQEHERVGNGK